MNHEFDHTAEENLAGNNSLNMAGIKGECNAFWSILKILNTFPEMKVYHNKIIPCENKTTGNCFDRELDIICIGKRKIFIFEVKYLSGKISIVPENGSWLQYNGNNGRCKEITDGFMQAARGADSVLQLLASKKLIEPSSGLIDFKVIFAHDNFDDSNIRNSNKQDYILLKNVKSYIYANDINGPAIPNRQEIIRLFESLKNMCIIKLKKINNAVNIHRGEIINGILGGKIYYKDSRKKFSNDISDIDYVRTFCETPCFIDISKIKILKIYGEIKNSFLAHALLKEENQAGHFMIFTPELFFKPRGQKEIIINLKNIDQISF